MYMNESGDTLQMSFPVFRVFNFVFLEKGKRTEKSNGRQEHDHQIVEDRTEGGEEAHLRSDGDDGADEAANLPCHPGGSGIAH